MVRRWVAGLIAAVVMMSVGGVGFAAFTSSVLLTTHDTAGSVTVVWVSPSTHPKMVPDLANDQCTDYLTPTAFLINVSNAGPGDGCSIPASDGIYLQNTGTINAELTLVTLLANGPCTWFYSDNFAPFGTSFPQPIAAGQSLPSGGYSIHIVLAGGSGNECQGALGFTNGDYQIVATAGT